MSIPSLWMHRWSRPFRHTGHLRRQFTVATRQKKRRVQELPRFSKNGPSPSGRKRKTLPSFVQGIAKNACYIEGWWNSPWLKAKVAALRRRTKSSLLGARDVASEDSVDSPDSGVNVRAPPSAGSFEVLTRLCEEGKLNDACEAIDFMDRQGIEAPVDILARLLHECVKSRDVAVGRQVHELICRSGLETNMFLANHLIRMYDVCGILRDADQVFRKLPAPSRSAWTAIISAHDRHGHAEQVLKLYYRMQQTCVKADFSIYVAVLKACSTASALTTGKLVHAQVTQGGYESNILVGNTLINMYVKCGSIEDAHKVFTGMAGKSLVSWNALIAGYSQLGDDKEAMKLFEDMQLEGIEPDAYTFVSVLNACSCGAALDQGKVIHTQIINRGYDCDVFVSNALIGMYSKCGSLKDARRVFDQLYTKDVVSWNTIIAAYSRNGDAQEAIQLYVQMTNEGMQPDKVTLITALKACGNILALDQGKLTHAHIVAHGLETDVFIGSSLIDMYFKCGHLEDSKEVFENLRIRDVATWNALISGYSHQGDGQEALDLFGRMQREGIQPDMVTLVSVLKACSSAGALDQGKLMHELAIKSGYQSNVFVGSVLIDMYVKCGDLAEAHRVFKSLSNKNLVTWTTLIAGYAKHGRTDDVRKLFQEMQESGLQPDEGTLVSISKAC